MRALLVSVVALLGAQAAEPTDTQARPPDRAVFRLSIQGMQPDAGEVAATVRFTAESDLDESWRSRPLSLRDGTGELGLSLDSKRAWRVQASAEGYWSPAVVVPPGVGRSVDLVLWPAGSVSVRLHPPDEQAKVESLHLSLRAAPELADPARPQPTEIFEVVCPVVERRVEECELPAGRWHLRMEASSFAPNHSWDLEIEPGKTRDLGVLELRMGGSIFGQVVTTEGPVDARDLSVELRPRIDPDPVDAEVRRDLEVLTRSAKANPRGYFQFVGVPPGAFEITARHPGFSPAIRSSIEVRRGEWTELGEPLVLEPMLRLSAFVVPAASPFGKRWTVHLHRPESTQSLRRVASGEVDDDGLWQSPPLPTGPYELQILADNDDSIVWQEIDLREGSDQVYVDIPLIYVEGKVLLDDEPIAARLWFGGRSGTERVEAESDEEGEFLVVLPREGTWPVDVFADTPPVKSVGLEVEVEPIADLRVADVVLELPNTRLTGEVVDEAGLPLTEPAQLHVVPLSGDDRRERFLGTRTDALGRFEVLAMAQGTYSVEATSPHGSTESVVLGITEGRDASVQLTLRAKRTMVGTVVSESGPVPQALVMAYPVVGPGQRPGFESPTTRTGVDGRFRMNVPGTATTMRLTVLAPGYALALQRVSEGSTIEVGLTQGGGTLSLEPSARAGSEVGLVMVQGEPMDLPSLETWARMNGASPDRGAVLVVDAMPAGDYAYCRFAVEEALLVLSGMALPSGRGCTQGFLAPGGELRLSAPS